MFPRSSLGRPLRNRLLWSPDFTFTVSSSAGDEDEKFVFLFCTGAFGVEMLSGKEYRDVAYAERGNFVIGKTLAMVFFLVFFDCLLVSLRKNESLLKWGASSWPMRW